MLFGSEIIRGFCSRCAQIKQRLVYVTVKSPMGLKVCLLCAVDFSLRKFFRPLIDELYLGIVSHWEPDGLIIGADEPATVLRGTPLRLAGLDGVPRVMALDAVTYLSDDILCKVDRVAMAVVLESCVPFLDHRVLEFVRSIPQPMKIGDGVGKWTWRHFIPVCAAGACGAPEKGFWCADGRLVTRALEGLWGGVIGRWAPSPRVYFNSPPIRKNIRCSYLDEATGNITFRVR